MNNPPASATQNGLVAGLTSHWLWGVAVIAIGVANTSRGNNPGYGLFILVLSFVYVLAASALLKNASEQLILKNKHI